MQSTRTYSQKVEEESTTLTSLICPEDDETNFTSLASRIDSKNYISSAKIY